MRINVSNTKGGQPAIQAALIQEDMLRRHITRLELLKAERYKIGTFEWITAFQEIERWRLVLSVVEANLKGQTVQPS